MSIQFGAFIDKAVTITSRQDIGKLYDIHSITMFLEQETEDFLIGLKYGFFEQIAFPKHDIDRVSVVDIKQLLNKAEKLKDANPSLEHKFDAVIRKLTAADKQNRSKDAKKSTIAIAPKYMSLSEMKGQAWRGGKIM